MTVLTERQCPVCGDALVRRKKEHISLWSKRKTCSRECARYLPRMNARRPLEERFREKFTQAGPDECWIWKGATGPKGHGHINRGTEGGGSIGAHVLAAIYDGRTPPLGFHVHHVCETPACVNPAHLQILSPLEHRRAHRDDTCRRGHPRSEAYIRRGTDRVVYCKTCKREDYAALSTSELERRRASSRERAAARKRAQHAS